MYSASTERLQQHRVIMVSVEFSLARNLEVLQLFLHCFQEFQILFRATVAETCNNREEAIPL